MDAPSACCLTRVSRRAGGSSRAAAWSLKMRSLAPAPSIRTGRICFRYTVSVVLVPEWPTKRAMSSSGTPLSDSSDTKLCRISRGVQSSGTRPAALRPFGSPGVRCVRPAPFLVAWRRRDRSLASCRQRPPSLCPAGRGADAARPRIGGVERAYAATSLSWYRRQSVRSARHNGRRRGGHTVNLGLSLQIDL